jgi:hypothetical protein
MIHDFDSYTNAVDPMRTANPTQIRSFFKVSKSKLLAQTIASLIGMVFCLNCNFYSLQRDQKQRKWNLMYYAGIYGSSLLAIAAIMRAATFQVH